MISQSDFYKVVICSHSILKQQRISLDLTQQEVADRAAIHLQSYQQFESGTRDITRASFRLACRVFEALELYPRDFYNGECAIK